MNKLLLDIMKLYPRPSNTGWVDFYLCIDCFTLPLLRPDRPAAGRICVLALCSSYTRWGGLAHGLHGLEGDL